ncbi:hypothetical protein [Alteromonas sp. a30]|uniref:hypothetical protein n=1 Tax=Alteromonas sp. a30 TaxID=2730917 RepID=UPI002281F24A|nr:hypothetical protein [Alteromonas sp. a30]MCY7294211.1 hypothetical protein [Alteromonas sp. a30]
MSNLKIELIDTTNDKNIAGEKDPLVIDSIRVTREVNRIPTANITFLDPSDKFIKRRLKLGSKLTLKVSQNEAKLLFIGTIVKIDAKITSDGDLVDITLKSPLNALTQKIQHRSFTFEQNPEMHPLMQRHISDWDFLVCLADLYRAWIVEEISADEKLEQKLMFFQQKPLDMNNYEHTSHLGDYKIGANQGNSKISLDKIEFEKHVGKPVVQPTVQLKPDTGAGYDYLLGKKTASKILEIENAEAAGGNYGEFQYHNDKPKDNNKEVRDLLLNYRSGLLAGDQNSNKPAKTLALPNAWPSYLPKRLEKSTSHFGIQMARAREWKVRNALLRGKMKLINNDLVDEGRYQQDKPDKPDEKGNIALFLGRKLFVGQGMGNLIDFEGDPSKATALLTRINHSITEKGWETTLEWGSSPKFHIEEFPDMQRPPAKSILPGLQGIHIAVVNDDSPRKDGDVKAHLFDINTVFTFRKITRSASSKVKGDKQKKDNVEHKNRRQVWPSYKKGDLILVSFTESDPAHGVALAGIDLPLFQREA